MTDQEATAHPDASAAPRARAWLMTVLRWLCILLPAFLLARLMRENLVNIPFLDDFMFTPMIEKSMNSGLDWHDFFMAQMEHRLAFVRALIMLRHHFWPRDITVENWFTFAFLCGTALNVGVLLKRTAGGFSKWWPALAFACLAIFSTVQFQIVLWAMMFQVACPAFFLSLVLMALTSKLPPWLRWIIGVMSALCALLCLASGALVWVLPVFVMLFGGVLPTWRARLWFTGLWLVAFLVTMLLYFQVTVAPLAELGERKALLPLPGDRVLTFNMHNEAEGRFSYKQNDDETMGRNVKSFVGSSEKLLPFILRLLGSNLARGTGASLMNASLIIGAVSALLFAAAFLFWLLRFKDESMRHALAPWIAFGSYSEAAATLVCLGRVWATSTGNNSVSPRYTIHAVPLTVSLCAMAVIIAADLRSRHPSWSTSVGKMLLVLSLVLLGLQTVSWLHGERMMESWSSARLRMATNTLFFGPPHVEEHVEMDANIAPNFTHARTLDSLKLLNPPMIEDSRLENFKVATRPLAKTNALWETLIVDLDHRTAHVRGYASLAGRKRVADGVFLTCRDPKNGGHKIFHVSQVQALPLYLLDTIGRDMQNIQVADTSMETDGIAAFDGEFSLDVLPEGVSELSAWAFDYREQTAYPIVGGFKLDRTSGKVEPVGK